MIKLKLVQIGDSVGLILPKKILARLNLIQGDAIYAIESGNGLILSPHNPEMTRQVEIGREFMRENHDTFRGLAK